MDLISQLPFDLIKGKDLVIRRRSDKGTYVKGKWVPAGTSDVTIYAVYNERIPYNTIMLLPEALRTKRKVRIFSNDEIRQKNKELGHDADDFTYHEQEYRVWNVEHWIDVNGFSCYQALAVKIDSEVLALIP